MEINGIEERERLYEIRFREHNALKWKGKSFVEREGITDGTMRMKVYDGAGKSHTKDVFAGSIQQTPTQHSDTNEFNPKEEWSNGSDTREIEAKLRATKTRLHYTEPETHQHGGKRTGAGRRHGT